MSDTLSFADFDPVTGPPTIDGFVYPDPGIVTDQVEPGYVLGSRLTYGTGSLSPVVVQTVKNGNHLTIALLCRFDPTFDDEDVVIVAFRPSFGTAVHDDTVRRIDISPLWKDLGAIDPSTPSPGDKENVPPAPGVPSGHDYHIRLNRPPHTVNYYRGPRADETDQWIGYSPVAPSEFQIRCRSWKPPVGAGSPEEDAWSIELQVPIGTGTATNWTPLADGFGLFIDLVRIDSTGPDPFETVLATQFRFPRASPHLTGSADVTLVINPGSYGQGLIPGLQVPPGNNLGLGVRFVPGDNWEGATSVGRRDRGTLNPLDDMIQGPASAPGAGNELVAFVENTGPTAAANVTAEFRFANWGLNSPSFLSWDQPSGLAPNPSAAATIGAGGNATLTSEWPRSAVPAGYAAHPHRCMWVQLDSTSGVNFVQSSVRRNMNFTNLSGLAETAQVSGIGYPPPPGGKSHHDFLLRTFCRKIVTPPRPEVNLRATVAPKPPSVTYLWITEGLRRTGDTLKVGKRVCQVLDPAPGAFGYNATHETADDTLQWSFSGPGLQGGRKGAQWLRVPHGGTTEIGIRLWTEPPGRLGGHGGHGRRKLPWWAWLLLILGLLWLLD